MNRPRRRGSFHGAGLGVTAAIAMVICCAAPALLAGGLLASLGAIVGNPLVIALGLTVVGGAVVFALVHRRRRAYRLPDRTPLSGEDPDPRSVELPSTSASPGQPRWSNPDRQF